MKNEDSEKILESFVQKPEFTTASHLANTLTTYHEDFSRDEDDLFALFGVE
jgi:hypothetical protein